MLGKNIKYYRLKKNMTKKDLAEAINMTPMAITYYENDERQPSMETIKNIANVLGVKVTDFLANTDNSLHFSHGKFRKGTKLGIMMQEYIKESVEEYFNRFFQTLSFLGGQQILETPPKINAIQWTDDIENAAEKLREYLGISMSGPVNNLVEILENKGILVYFIEIDNHYFSGMNGTVNGLPYIVINSKMSTARIRSTIVHEIVHFAFEWPESLSDKQEEELATAIGGAFLFSKKDAIRELGYKRNSISRAMTITCKEYGISLLLLAKRAKICGIINDSAERDFYIKAGKLGWRKSEPDWGITEEEPTLFKQLVFRAVSEEEISVQKGAELLKSSYDSVAKACFI